MNDVALFGTLHKGNILLGRLFHSDEPDLVEFAEEFDFSAFRFEATPEFSLLRPLFNSVLGAIKLEDQAQEKLSWKKIDALDLILKLQDGGKKLRVRAPIGPGDTISLFENPENVQLYIDAEDKMAWFRLW